MAESNGIAVVGSGYVGTVAAACFASLGHRVVGIEIDHSKLDVLQAGRVPFFEPGLEELVNAQLEADHLSFTDDYQEALGQSSLIFLCVGTPPGSDGHPDLTALSAAGRAIAGALVPEHVIVTKSTVPIGNGSWLRRVITSSLQNGTAPPFSVVANPEFLREGRAVSDFLAPERIVLGSDDPDAIDRVATAYQLILEQSFPGGDPSRKPELIRTDLVTAETIKYAANAFLATKISFINEIAAFCEPAGADIKKVAEAIGLDSRIGPDFLNAGIGWGGSCFGKDLTALSAAAARYGEKLKILQAVQDVNSEQRRAVVEKLQRHLGTLEGRRIAILGLAFKPGTDDVRDSPAVDIAGQLLAAGAVVNAHDPVVEEIDGLRGLATFGDIYDAVDNAEAVVIATDWPDFLDLDFDKLAESMSGRLFFDGRNLFDPQTVVDAGFDYEGIGRGHSPAPSR